MKRFLSLALVLIMVIGIMPTALAADCTGEHTWVVDTENSKAPTCKEAGVAAYKCSVEGCTATKTEPIDLIDHSIADDAWTGTEPTCVEDGKKTATCPVCGTIVQKITAATGEHTFVDGKCSVCGESEIVEKPVYTASAANIELTVGEGQTMQIVYTLNGAPATVTPASVTFTSSDAAVASVNSSTGMVRGIKKGTATVTATITGVNAAPIAVSCTVTVNDAPKIVCESRETDESKVTLAPILYIDGIKVDDALFNFDVDGEADYGDDSKVKTLTLEREEVEIVEVKISVASFTGSDDKAGDPDDVEDITVFVSFYDYVKSEATVKAGVSSFMFDDKNVFSDVEYDGKSVSTPSSYDMRTLWYSESDWLTIDLYLLDPDTDVATITYPGSTFNAFDPDEINTYTSVNTAQLKFTCLKKGEFELFYDLFDKATGLIVQSGKVTINVTEGGAADVEYKTTFSKELVLEENDFAKLWNKAKMDSDLDYVVFEYKNLIGELLTDGSNKADEVTDKMEFAYDYDEDDDDYDLDEVTYVPYSKATKSYEDAIYFTCVGEDDDEELHGLMVITVGEEVSFSDVKKSDYFYDAVEWAVNAGVTAGTSKTTFSPNATCTREQVVTFLWRAAGEPEPKGTVTMKFKDVDKDAYYYDAVMWAVEEGITTGTSSTTFSPKATVTRGQVVTFLHRAMGEKAVSASNPFTDVKKADYYYEAVLWAVKNDVTTGLSATSFGPNSGCTRGQIVTFLFRAYEG